MTRDVSDTLKAAANAPETDAVFCLLLTLSHPALDDDIRLTDQGLELLPVAQERGVASRGLEFIKFPFQFQLPGEGDNQSPMTQLSCVNVDRRIVKAVRAVAGSGTRIGVKAEVVLVGDPDTVEMSLEGFQLIDTTYDQMIVKGNVSLEYYENNSFPGDFYTPSGFPGLFA